jgi:AraC family transcriptional regulator
MQKKIIIDGTIPGASSTVFPTSSKLSSYKDGWNDINYEYHYQPPGFLPECNNTELVIAIGHSPMSIQRRLAGEFREENTQPGDILVNPAYSPQAGSWESSIAFSLWLLKSKDIAQTAFDHIDPDHIEVLPHFSKPDPLIYGLAESLKMQIELDLVPDKLYLESIRSTAIFHVLRHYSNRKIIDINTPGGLTTQSLKTVIDYINANFYKDFGLTELANLVGISNRYFSELFKKSTGFPPSVYVLKFRLFKAEKMLLTTKLSIIDIASRAGFSSSNDLCRAFRKYYNKSPQKFREHNL